MNHERMEHPGTHYRIQIIRDDDATNPLEDDVGVINYEYYTRRYELRGEASLIAALEANELGDYLPDTLLSGMSYDLANLNPLELNWHELYRCSPFDLNESGTYDPRYYDGEAADNRALLEWAGVDDITDEMVYSDGVPQEVEDAMYKYLTEEKYVIDSFTADGDRSGTYLCWAERADIQEKWDTRPENVDSSFKATLDVARQWASGYNWGFVLTKVVAPDDYDGDNDDLDEVNSNVASCWGFTAERTDVLLGGYMDCHWSHLPEAEALAITATLADHMGAYVEECDILVAIPDAPTAPIKDHYYNY